MFELLMVILRANGHLIVYIYLKMSPEVHFV